MMESCELLRRCAAGADDNLWSDFVSCFAADLRGGVCAALRRSGLALTRERIDDLTQEVYCRLLEADRCRLRGFRGAHAGEAACFVARLATNAALDVLRTTLAAKRGGGQQVTLDACFGLLEPVAVEADPEARLLAREQRRLRLSRCQQVLSRRVSRRDLRIFRLAVIEDVSSQEIAARFGLATTGVDAVMMRLRQRLAAAGIEVPLRPRGRRRGGARGRSG